MIFSFLYSESTSFSNSSKLQPINAFFASLVKHSVSLDAVRNKVASRCMEDGVGVSDDREDAHTHTYIPHFKRNK